MAAPGSWAQIRRDGLLSTSALLDAYRVTGDERRLLESCRRGKSRPIRHSDTGETACIRDSGPITEKLLAKKLTGGMKPQDWYRLLNAHVFFWVRENDLRTFLSRYGNTDHDVITVSTRRLVERDHDRIAITPFNTGSIRRLSEYERGPDTFSTIYDFDLDRWRKRIQHRPPIVELAVRREVPRIEEVALLVQRRRGGYEIRRTVWSAEPLGSAGSGEP